MSNDLTERLCQFKIGQTVEHLGTLREIEYIHPDGMIELAVGLMADPDDCIPVRIKRVDR